MLQYETLALDSLQPRRLRVRVRVVLLIMSSAMSRYAHSCGLLRDTVAPLQRSTDSTRRFEITGPTLVSFLLVKVWTSKLDIVIRGSNTNTLSNRGTHRADLPRQCWKLERGFVYIRSRYELVPLVTELLS